MSTPKNKDLSLIAMGVINITPDSFSDGGMWLDRDKLSQHLLDCWQAKVLLDVGAESTAPGAPKLSGDVEWDRWEKYFFPAYEGLLKKHQAMSDHSVSIDSYHSSTVSKVIKRLVEIGMNGTIIWNDISGKFDDHVCECLSNYPQLKYIYCYNRAPSRNESQDHLKYVHASEMTEREYFLHMVNYFHSAIIQASKIKAVDRLILDPTFGFSKTREQNFRLWKMLPKIAHEIGHPDWLIGVSRKSFLRPSGQKITEPGAQEKSEWSESFLLGDLIANFLELSVIKNLMIRNHRLDLLNSLIDFHLEKMKA